MGDNGDGYKLTRNVAHSVSVIRRKNQRKFDSPRFPPLLSRRLAATRAIARSSRTKSDDRSAAGCRRRQTVWSPDSYHILLEVGLPVVPSFFCRTRFVDLLPAPSIRIKCYAFNTLLSCSPVCGRLVSVVSFPFRAGGSVRFFPDRSTTQEPEGTIHRSGNHGRTDLRHCA